MRAASRSRIRSAFVLSFTQNMQGAAGVLEQFEEILAQENFAAAQGQDEDAGLGHLVEQVLDFGGGHLAVIVVIEIAMDAAFVAAVGEVELDAERNIAGQRFPGHLLREVRSSGFSGDWLRDRFFRDLQDLVAGQFAGQGFGILQGLGGLDFELGADADLRRFHRAAWCRRRTATGWSPSCSA